MTMVSMFTFRVFEWAGSRACACYFLLRPARVLSTLAIAFFVEPFTWSTRPWFLRCLSPVSAPAASFARPFALSMCLLVMGAPWWLGKCGASNRSSRQRLWRRRVDARLPVYGRSAGSREPNSTAGS